MSFFCSLQTSPKVSNLSILNTGRDFSQGMINVRVFSVFVLSSSRLIRTKIALISSPAKVSRVNKIYVILLYLLGDEHIQPTLGLHST